MFFNRAVLRQPGEEIINGLSQNPQHEKPNFKLALAQHVHYAETLRKIGLLPLIHLANKEFPDGCFTEDTHLILNEVVIRLNPGTPSRSKEPDSLQRSLPKDRPYERIPNDFTIDGGDILVCNKRIYVGLSSRTQPQAITALEKIVTKYQYQVLSVPVPEGLHLKTGMTAVNPDTFLVQKPFLEILKSLHAELNEEKNYFIVPPEEEFAANVLPLNDAIIIPPNCPKTKAFLLNYFSEDKINEVDTSEFRKVDGALTCLSIPYRC